MFFSTPIALLSLSALLLSFGVANPLQRREPAAGCTFETRKAAIAAEIKTIGSHAVADADKIPLSLLATWTFFVTPAELGGAVTLPPINVGVTAQTVRLELVGLATFLNAGVPPNSVKYIDNANGSTTVDFIQTDRAVLSREHVREIHEFNEACEITKITGFVNGPLACPEKSDNAIVTELRNEMAKAKTENS